MRSLIISIVSIAVILSGWLIFVSYADKNIHQLINTIEDDILVSVYAGNWGNASEQLEHISDKWHDHKKVYTFFFDTENIMATEYSMAKAKYYIKSEDVPLSAGELNLLREQLKFLHLNELITLDNIF